MKKTFLMATATLAMFASCTSEEIPERPVDVVKSPIEFKANPGYMTRATGADAAALLGKNFTVYGYKVLADVKTSVFGGVNVAFNNEGVWDYTSATEETRYWDPNATSYSFLALSDANPTSVVNAPAVADIANGITIGNTTSNVTLEQLQKVYVAPVINVEKQSFTSPIHFQFHNAAAKVRVAFYNAIPGYDVKIDNFYTTISGNAGANTNVSLLGTFFDGAAYSADASANTSVIGTPSTTNMVTLGNHCSGRNIARSITEATFDQANKAWTWVMPVYDQGGDIQMKLDYRLVSKHEEIAHTSTVTIPANFNKWEANHAYTYYFKITDNDLHPITFTAEVTDFDTNETITTIDAEQQADITTFAAGSDVQGNDQYKVGDDIYVGVANVSNPTVEVAFTTDDDIDGSNAGGKTLDYDTLHKIASGTYAGCYLINEQTTSQNGAGFYVIRVTYKCNVPEHTADHHAYKVIRVVE